MPDRTEQEDTPQIQRSAGEPRDYRDLITAVLDAVEEETGPGPDAELAVSIATAHDHLLIRPPR